MKPPLDVDEKIWQKRNERVKKYWKRFPQWVKGYKSGKQGRSKKDNPYTLSPDIIRLLQKRTLWILGYEEATYTPSRSRLKKIEEDNKKKKHKKHHG